MALYLAFGDVIASWARGRTTGGAAGAADFRCALAIYMNQGAKADAPYFHGLLGKFVAESGDRAGALAVVDQGLRFAHETGEHWSDPELYRIRGEVLSASDPARLAAAEDAFETASAVARGQGSRIFRSQGRAGAGEAAKFEPSFRSGGRRSRRGSARLLADAVDTGDRRGPDAARGAQDAPAHELNRVISGECPRHLSWRRSRSY